MSVSSLRNACIILHNFQIHADKRIDFNKDITFITGENGSGKTTLMKGLLGLNSPVKGEIIYNGIDKNQIGYLPQKKNIQRDFPASVMEVVLSGCVNRKGHIFHNKTDKEIAIKNLSMVKMENMKKL